MHDPERKDRQPHRGRGPGNVVALALVGASLVLGTACGGSSVPGAAGAQEAPRAGPGGGVDGDGRAESAEAGIDGTGGDELPGGGASASDAASADAPAFDPEERPPLPSVDELVAGLDLPPADLPIVLDPTLLLSTDPQDFPASRTVGGEAVEILREYHPTSDVLLRIALVRPEQAEDEEGAARVVHGPQWRYYDTAALRTEQWFKDGVAHGPSRQWRRVGTMVFEGRFWNGERDGLRREYSKNGQLISVRTYTKGRQQGAQEEWFGSGQRKEESEYLDDQLHGRRRVWGRDGLLVLDENYESGVLHGRWSDFHPAEGTPREWGTYQRGKREGIWQRGAVDGTIIASVEYANGKPHGRSQIWNPDGKLVEEYRNVDGQKSGRSRTWYADGTPQSEGELEKGLRVGRWTYWKTDGSVNERWTGIYQDDLKVSDLED